MWRSTARFVIPSLEAIEPLLRPSAIRARISSSRGVSFVELRVAALAGGDELVDDPRVDQRAARGHVVQRPAQLALVVQPLLEQVRAPVRARVEERERVARLRVLAEHDDAHLRVLFPELGGEADALVRVRGRHPDVGQDDVGRRALDRVAQLVEVARHLDQLDVLDVAEDADDPLAGEEAVLGGDNADRHQALEPSHAPYSPQTVVPAPRGQWCARPRPNPRIPQCPRAFSPGYSSSEGVTTFVHDGRGGWDGEVEIEPVEGNRRFGVGRRPLNRALRELGAKAILVGPSDSGVLVDVVESKLRPPPGQPESVPRTALVNRLRAAGAFPIVLVVAPAGYGKTTLLSQWAARDARPFAWVSVDERDNDPYVLLKHVAAALDRIEPLGAHVTEAFERPEWPVWDAIVPRLSAELSSRSPFVIVLDGADALVSTDSTEAIGILIENIPPGSMIALTGRALPRMPIAALRVAEPLLEIGSYELALSRREAEILLRASGVELDETELAGLLHRTEGWAAGLRLAALASLEDGASRPAGDDRYIADYLGSEYLSRLEPRVLRFLRRTSVLERMCAPLCNAVLSSKGSAARARGDRAGEPVPRPARPPPRLVPVPPSLPRPPAA